MEKLAKDWNLTSLCCLLLSFLFLLQTQNINILTKIPIQNSAGDFITPDATTIGTGEYNPFSRRIYMNILDDQRVLEAMQGFFTYGFSDSGKAAVESVGYVPIPNWESVVMLHVIGAKDDDLSSIQCGTASGELAIAGSSTVFPVAQLWSEIYKAKCTNIRITVEGGGSSRGASRVCGTNSDFGTVDIGVSTQPKV